VIEPLGDDYVAIEIEAAQETAGIGRVVDTGDRAAGLRGRRVLVGPIDPCGECEVCRRGGATVCPFAKRRDPIGNRVIAAGRWVVPLGDGLELPMPGAAAVAGDVAIAYTLYARTGLGPRDPVIIVGASSITRFLVEILVAKSITPTVVAEPSASAWCAWLVAKGASVACVTPDGDLRATVAAAIATPQRDATALRAKPWRVIATSPDAALQAARLAGPRATLTILAPAPALPGELVDREVTVIGVAGAHPDLVVEVAAMCAKREIDLVDGTSTTPNEVMRAIVSVH